MNRCPTCNAPMEDPLEPCRFCGAVTPEGLAAKKERARAEEELRLAEERRLQDEAARARAQAEEEARRARAKLETELNSSGTQAIVWSLVSLLCCLPIGPVVGIVIALRARRLAAARGLPAGRATAGLAVAISSLVLCFGAWVGVGISIHVENQRKAELRAAIDKGAGAEQLDGPTACALAELEMIDAKYEGYTYVNADFKCSGRVVQEGDQARLLDAYFTESQKRTELVACFTKGARWAVKQLRADEDCNAPPPPKKNGSPNKKR